jgi:hypothetical protein
VAVRRGQGCSASANASGEDGEDDGSEPGDTSLDGVVSERLPRLGSEFVGALLQVPPPLPATDGCLTLVV